MYAPEAEPVPKQEEPGAETEERPAEAEANPEGAAEGKPEDVAEETKSEEQPPAKAKPVELTPEQKRVLEAIGGGATMPSLRKDLDDVKYTEILVAVRILIDAGYVTAETHGRGTTYRRVKKSENKEVKENA